MTSAVLGRLDPTLRENGLYRVRLLVEDVNGQISFAERVYRFGGEAKVGVLGLSFVDLQVPLSGIPITVIRSYDSRVKTQRDFGIGWSLQVKSGRYQNNRRPGDGWIVATAPGPFGLPCAVTGETLPLHRSPALGSGVLSVPSQVDRDGRIGRRVRRNVRVRIRRWDHAGAKLRGTGQRRRHLHQRRRDHEFDCRGEHRDSCSIRSACN